MSIFIGRTRRWSQLAAMGSILAGCTVHHHHNYNGPVTINGSGSEQTGASPGPSGAPCPVCVPVHDCGDARASAPPSGNFPRRYPAQVVVDPTHEAMVMSPIEGHVASIAFNVGDVVRAHDVVATIVPERGGRPIELRTPISGTVVERGGTVGEEVTRAHLVSLLHIAGLDPVWVVAAIPAAEFPRVRIGQLASIRIATYPDRVFEGRITRVLPLIDPDAGVGHAVVQVANPDQSLRPGESAIVEIQSIPNPTESTSSSPPP